MGRGDEKRGGAGFRSADEVGGGGGRVGSWASISHRELFFFFLFLVPFSLPPSRDGSKIFLFPDFVWFSWIGGGAISDTPDPPAGPFSTCVDR